VFIATLKRSPINNLTYDVFQVPKKARISQSQIEYKERNNQSNKIINVTKSRFFKGINKIDKDLELPK
jgi:hypothetical protein